MLVQKQDVDYRTLNGSPSPEEFFLLSRVKGAVTVAQVCSVSGLGREKTIAALERLIQYGLLVREDGESEPQPRSPSVTSVPTVEPKPAPILAAPPVVAPKPRAPEPTSEPVAIDNDDDLFGTPATPQAPPKKASHSSFASVVESDAADLFEAGSVARIGSTARKTGAESQAAVNPSARPAPVPAAVAHAVPAMVIETTAYAPAGPAAATDYDDLFGGDPEVGISVERSEPIAIAPRVSLFDESDPAPSVSSAPAKVERDESDSVSRFAIPWEDFVPDPDLMALDVDIDDDRKAEILHMYANIGLMTHYELFGQTPDADRRAFKKPYFGLSKRFHPDLFFRKNVGEFGLQVETIFKTVTKAFQLLQNPQKRAEYDRSIAAESGAGLERPSEVSESDHPSKRDEAFRVLTRRGEKLEQAGAYSDAVDEYRKALALNRDVALILRCAILLLRAGLRLDEAAMYARALLAYDPNHLEGLVVLGSIYERNEMLEDALESYERAVHVSKGDASIRLHVERIKTELSQR